MTASEGDRRSTEHTHAHGFTPDAEFCRRVLLHMPTPIVVVNATGQIVYANKAMFDLGGWTLAPDANLDIMSFIHPEDRDVLVEAFAEIVGSPGARILGGRRWAEIFFRIVTQDGTTLPIELVGNGGLLDASVGGIIYEVRPALARDLLGRVLDGLSRGASMLQLLSLVGQMIASAPLDLDAVIFQSTPDSELILTSSTSPALSRILHGSQTGTPWERVNREPERVAPAALPLPIRQRVLDSEFQDLWHVSVESPLTATTLRIVAASPTHHVPATGSKNRLIRARELAAAVLLRAEADVLLAHAAERDALTDLPNRAAFYQLAESLDPMVERCAVQLDLDGLKIINDAYGANCGDLVLRIVADRVRACSSKTDLIGRIGDDEFAILLVAESSASALQERTLRLADQILEAVRDPVVLAGRPLCMSASIGISNAQPGVSTDRLLTWADAAMHDAKTAGGGRVHRYSVRTRER